MGEVFFSNLNEGIEYFQVDKHEAWEIPAVWFPSSNSHGLQDSQERFHKYLGWDLPETEN